MLECSACSCAFYARVLDVLTCSFAYVLACSCARPACHACVEFAKSSAMRACLTTWFTCQRACVLMFHKRANFSFLRVNVPINGTTFKLGVSTCQKACQFFKHSSYEILREISIKILLYKKFHIIPDIIVIYIIYIYIYIYIVHKNCITLYFYTSYHIKEKCMKFFFFLFLFFFFAL